MNLVYLLPLFLIVLVLAIFTGPLIAAFVFVAFLIGLGAFKFFGPGTEPEHAPPGEAPGAGTQVTSGREEAEGGVWGEKWPEQSQREEPSR